MNIRLVLTGKTEDAYLKEGIAKYSGRLAHYCKFSIVEIPELKKVSALSRQQIMQKEGELILKLAGPQDLLVLLDEHGHEYRSLEFADHLQKLMARGAKNLVFVIGGAYGFSDAVYNRSHERISLSRMTFSHQMVRTIFAEQLYRAFTILKGEPYHHE